MEELNLGRRAGWGCAGRTVQSEIDAVREFTVSAFFTGWT